MISLKKYPTLFLPWLVLAAGFLCETRVWADDIPTPKSFTTASNETLDELRAFHEKADQLIAENNFRGAIEIYTEILLIEPDDEIAYTRMGHAYMILGDFEKAEDAFKNALTINPENEIALLGLERIMAPDGT